MDRLAEMEGTSMGFDTREDRLGCSRQSPADATTFVSGTLRGQPWKVVHWSQVQRSCALAAYAGETGFGLSMTVRGISDVSLGPLITDRLVTGGVPADVRRVDVEVDGVRTTAATVAVPGTQQRFYGAVVTIADASTVAVTVVLHHDDGRREVLGP